MDTEQFQTLLDWLIDGARSAPTGADFFRGTCERLLAAGIPVDRVSVFVRTPHPDVFGRRFVWQPGHEIVVTMADFDLPDSPLFRQSPLAILYGTQREVRFQLDDTVSRGIPYLDELRAEGVTDYLALPLFFTDGSMQGTSWTTSQVGGFTDQQLDALRRLVVPFARLAEIFALRFTAATLLDTYVGNQAGERILAGQIRRGHAEAMRAAIWLSDLRGFTALSDRLPPEIVVDILNRYFDCQVPAIRQHGGEILKFMGDGLLAVFPIARDGDHLGEVCGRVLAAARQARASVLAMQYANGEVVERFRFGVALHIGSVLFGNIGGASRLDFTCIGPAVNLAARLEKVAARLRRIVVASEAVAEICPADFIDLGEFPIAGLAPRRVFGLREEAAAQNANTTAL